jgi:hypothetical protein
MLPLSEFSEVSRPLLQGKDKGDVVAGVNLAKRAFLDFENVYVFDGLPPSRVALLSVTISQKVLW